jgi:D-psicose/D-tagatose/L-ribulose 3-epimerase
LRFGICCGPGSAALTTAGNPLSGLPRLMEILSAAGADYLEFGVGVTMPEAPESEFEPLRDALAGYPIRIEAFNVFIPGSYRLTGPDADHDRALSYCSAALPRCHGLGAEVVVLGSAGARRVPPGFDSEMAMAQFEEFLRRLGPIAAGAGVTIAIEPLNRTEDNLLISVERGIELVDAVAHPHIQLLADLYHIAMEKEPLEYVARAGARLRHTHCADLGRAAPGFARAGEEDFLGFFRNLRAAGYDARCSFEGSFTDIEQQSGPLLALLRRRWEQSA